MPRHLTSFARALKDAEKRLEKAQTERQLAKQKVIELDAEIPRLQQIIASLSGKVVMPIAGEPRSEKTVTLTGDQPSGQRADGIPPEILKYVVPQVLDGMGSVPATPVEPPKGSDGSSDPNNQ